MSMSFHFFTIVFFSLSWSFLTFQVPCPERLLTWDLAKFFRLSTSSNIHNRVVCVPLCVHVCVSVLYICMFCVLYVLLLPLFFQGRMLIPRGLKLFIQSHTENRGVSDSRAELSAAILSCFPSLTYSGPSHLRI